MVSLLQSNERENHLRGRHVDYFVDDIVSSQPADQSWDWGSYREVQIMRAGIPETERLTLKPGNNTQVVQLDTPHIAKTCGFIVQQLERGISFEEALDLCEILQDELTLWVAKD